MTTIPNRSWHGAFSFSLLTSNPVALLMALCLLLNVTLASAAPGWNSAANLQTARADHTATLLLNGKVLVAGGQGINGGYLASAELYDPSSNTWTPAGALASARKWHTSTLLSNGKVLVAGGYNGVAALASADLYDPASNTWTPAGNLPAARNRARATLLPNGKVLLSGGYSDGNARASASLYDPASNSWTPAAKLLTARYRHSSLLLPNGKVLVAGGDGLSDILGSAELYDPASNTWTPAGALATPGTQQKATRLANGKVLVVGGNGFLGTLDRAELYDEATNTWTPAGTLATARFSHTATRLSDGTVLVAGGDNGGSLASAELYDPSSNAWTATGALVTAREKHTATLLSNGTVLVAGGDNGSVLASAELYTPVPQNYSDSWWNANESGWGITITDHDTNLFVQWYTYDQTGHNQKYVISGGTFSNGKCQFSGAIQHVTGPSWTLPAFDPNQVSRTTVGSGTIDFCPVGLTIGTIVFNYTADGVTGSKQLTRLPFGNDVPHWGETANTGAIDFTDLWWNPSESGWGVSVTQHGNNIFFRVFVYDTDGRPLLFVVPGVTFNSATSFTGALQLTTGPWFGSNPFDPNQVVRTTAGSATLTFSDANNGVLSYTVNGVTKTKSITRLAF